MGRTAGAQTAGTAKARSLAPGAGGRHFPSGWYGGGGGGVVVEGSGPAASPYQGQGYGGGGARYGERYGRGLQGLVLVEIQSGGSHDRK